MPTSFQAFSCAIFGRPSTHPLYGPITAARHQLEPTKPTTASAVFYQKHIANHFKLRLWEWNMIRANLMILDLASSADTSLARDAILQTWLFDYVKISHEQPQSKHLSAMEVFEKAAPRRHLRQQTMFGEVLWSAAPMCHIFTMRLMTFISPPLENVAIAVLQTLRSRFILARPLIRGIITQRRYSSIAIILYAIRLRHFPWLFASPRNSPWTDLKDAFAHPFEPETVQISTRVVDLLQESVVNTIALIDAVGLSHPALARYLLPLSIRKAVFGSDTLLRRQSIQSTLRLFGSRSPYLLSLAHRSPRTPFDSLSQFQ